MIGIPEFDTYQEREKWLIENAEGFSIVRKANRKTYKGRVRTLEQALNYGSDVLKQNPNTTLLIYAVYHVYDTWIASLASDHKGQVTIRLGDALSEQRKGAPNTK